MEDKKKKVTIVTFFTMIKLMVKYEILEHKADLKIRVFGKKKPELFSNALSAMAENMKPEIEKLEKRSKRKFWIKSSNLSNLLVDFLSEILYLSQINKEVYGKVKFEKFSNTELKGELFGRKVKRFGEDIKAVTYHALDIHQKKDGRWEATLLFDI